MCNLLCDAHRALRNGSRKQHPCAVTTNFILLRHFNPLLYTESSFQFPMCLDPAWSNDCLKFLFRLVCTSFDVLDPAFFFFVCSTRSVVCIALKEGVTVFVTSDSCSLLHLQTLLLWNHLDTPLAYRSVALSLIIFTASSSVSFSAILFFTWS